MPSFSPDVYAYDIIVDDEEAALPAINYTVEDGITVSIKKEAKILAKIEKLKAKEVIYEEKVQNVILELSELDSNKNLNSSSAKETKLLREIETYQARYDAATSNEEKVKYEKHKFYFKKHTPSIPVVCYIIGSLCRCS